MKKRLIVLLAIAMILCLAACGAAEPAIDTIEEVPVAAEKPADEPVGMPNPMVEYSSLQEINEKIDVNLLPPSDTGVTNEKFFVISDSIAHYTCEYEGREWTFRAAHITDEDISGMQSEHNVYEPFQDTGLYTNEFYLDRFFDGDRQYTIVVTEPITEDGEIIMGEDVFADRCTALESIQKWHMDDPLVGDYQDRVGQRASACVERFDTSYNISVNWADSVDVMHSWTMYDAVLEGDRLTYAGEEIGCYTYDAEGEVISSEESTSEVPGYFEIHDGVLCWTGASQEECRACEFEKIVY